MTDTSIVVSSLQQALPDVAIELVPSIDGHPTIYVPRDALIPVARALRDRDDLAFSLLVELTAVDFWPSEPRFEIVYMLVSIAHRRRLRMKIRLHGDDAHIATATGVWPAANWLEREVWDLFGVAFDGHPDPRRLLMPDDWEGHPLRKDYPVQIRQRVRYDEPLQVTEGEFLATLQRDRLVRE